MLKRLYVRSLLWALGPLLESRDSHISSIDADMNALAAEVHALRERAARYG